MSDLTYEQAAQEIIDKIANEGAGGPAFTEAVLRDVFSRTSVSLYNGASPILTILYGGRISIYNEITGAYSEIYSGDLAQSIQVSNPNTVRTIDATHFGKLAYDGVVADALLHIGIIDEADVNNFYSSMPGTSSGSGIFAEGSARLGADVKEQVFTISPDADPNRMLGIIESPEILSSGTGSYINGINLNTLSIIHGDVQNDLYNVDRLVDVSDVVNVKSAEIVSKINIGIDSFGRVYVYNIDEILQDVTGLQSFDNSYIDSNTYVDNYSISGFRNYHLNDIGFDDYANHISNGVDNLNTHGVGGTFSHIFSALKQAPGYIGDAMAVAITLSQYQELIDDGSQSDANRMLAGSLFDISSGIISGFAAGSVIVSGAGSLGLTGLGSILVPLGGIVGTGYVANSLGTRLYDRNPQFLMMLLIMHTKFRAIWLAELMPQESF